MQELEWVVAEDTFLARQCRLERLAYGLRYSYPAPHARRFNAVRITDATTLANVDWDRELPALAAYFHESRTPLTLQLPEPMQPPAAGGPWRQVGNPFVHVRTSLADFRGPLDPTLSLRRCENERDVETFVRMVLDARLPPELREPAVQRTIAAICANLDSEDVPYLLEQTGAAVGAALCLPVPSGYTVAGLTVAEGQRGRGLMKAIYAALARLLEGNLYGQIEDGLITLHYRRSLPSTKILARTRTFQPTNDPYAQKR